MNQIQNNKFKKAIIILREDGFAHLVKKIFFYIKNLSVVKRIIFLYKRKPIVGKMKNFTSPNIDGYFDFITNSFSGLFAPMQVREEFLSLLTIFKEEKPEIIMEIGTANGGTLFCLSKLAPVDATIISLDLPEGKFGGGYTEDRIPVYKAFVGKEQTLHLLREDSHIPETLEKVKNMLNGQLVDFLFIDGDHSYEGVKKDFEMYSKIVRTNGGIVAFHDVAPKGLPESVGGVPRFWNEVKNKYKLKEFIKDPEQTGYGIGILYL